MIVIITTLLNFKGFCIGGPKGKYAKIHHIILGNTFGVLYSMVRCENVLQTRNKDGMSKLI